MQLDGGGVQGVCGVWWSGTGRTRELSKKKIEWEDQKELDMHPKGI